MINLEVPIGALHRALKSAVGATSAQLRLTKKGDVPMLSLTIVDNVFMGMGMGSLDTTATTNSTTRPRTAGHDDEFGDFDFDTDDLDDFPATSGPSNAAAGPPRERETVITQDIPVKVLSLAAVEGIHEPRCREPDIHIMLPSLMQLKPISERFTRLALTSTKSTSSTTTSNPRLTLSATMHGTLRLSLTTPSLSISSSWISLTNPDLDPSQLENGSQSIRDHPSTIMKTYPESDPRAWANVTVDAKDWGRVLSVGRLGGRVIACLIDGTAVVMYVYLDDEEDGEAGTGGGSGEGGTLTYYISGFSS
ncbi:putative cell cycle checkpoint protein [Phaeomoniella chlamydospora]|uniref:Putative cell cycle checkpoint protein n=1 Tax=Phaeomoniella chlamydospora TaxID=158046 RepID=A0A0G2FV80_PHACM|nr:putative cell cycle checkpoint protein [Phaeomoniella chlamydospora]